MRLAVGPMRRAGHSRQQDEACDEHDGECCAGMHGHRDFGLADAGCKQRRDEEAEAPHAVRAVHHPLVELGLDPVGLEVEVDLEQPREHPRHKQRRKHQIGVGQPRDQGIAERGSQHGDERRHPGPHPVDPLRTERQGEERAGRHPDQRQPELALGQAQVRLDIGQPAEQRAEREGKQEEAGEDSIMWLDHLNRLCAAAACCPAHG
jgi:hypothetical protein